MSKRKFLKDKRFQRSRFEDTEMNRALKKIITIILIVIVSVALCFLGANLYIDKKISSSTKLFVSLTESANYDEAMKLYRDVKESSLNNGMFGFVNDKREEVLTTIEQKISEMIYETFYDLSENLVRLSSRQTDMLESFAEITVREINRLYFAYLGDCLRGRNTQMEAVTVAEELKKVSNIKNSIINYEKQIPQIFEYISSYTSIEKAYEDGDYIKVLSDIHKDIDSTDGFVKEFLIKYLADINSTIYNKTLEDIDVMMSRGKYYSAKTLISKISPFYPESIELSERLNTCTPFTESILVEFSKPVEHLAIRPLISDRRFSFGKDGYALTAEDLMLTTSEFQKILYGLYENDYILIDIDSLVNKDGKYKSIMIPEGKKPLIISIEGLNYYASRRLSGNSQNLKVDVNGHVVSEYFDDKGRLVWDRNGEAIGILEQFTEEHPDFSFDGAKGNISLTGFECVFGYVTDRDQAEDRADNYENFGLGTFSISDAEIKENREYALKVIQTLKSGGWTFSSSTYGNISVGEVSYDDLINDSTKWKEQIGSLIGDCKVLLFPNGSVVNSKDPKGEYLISQGFLIHCGIGPTAYFNPGEHHLFMDRVALNGIALRTTDLSRFFDTSKVYDPSRSKKLR